MPAVWSLCNASQFLQHFGISVLTSCVGQSAPNTTSSLSLSHRHSNTTSYPIKPASTLKAILLCSVFPCPTPGAHETSWRQPPRLNITAHVNETSSRDPRCRCRKAACPGERPVKLSLLSFPSNAGTSRHMYHACLRTLAESFPDFLTCLHATHVTSSVPQKL